MDAFQAFVYVRVCFLQPSLASVSGKCPYVEIEFGYYIHATTVSLCAQASEGSRGFPLLVRYPPSFRRGGRGVTSPVRFVRSMGGDWLADYHLTPARDEGLKA